MKNNSYWLVGGAILLAAAAGFSGGRASSKKELSSLTEKISGIAGINGKTTRSGQNDNTNKIARNSRASHATGQSGRNLEQTIDSLLKQLELTPMNNGVDFDEYFKIWETIRTFSEADVQHGIEQIGKTDKGEHHMMLQMMLMNRWAKLNGKAAMQFSVENLNTQMQSMVSGSTFSTWAKTSPDEAVAWLEKHHDEFGSNGIIPFDSMIYSTLARQDVTTAIEKASELDSNRRRKEAFNGIARGIGSNPEKLLSFFQSVQEQTDDSTAKQVRSDVVQHLCYTSPETTKTLILGMENAQEKKALTKKLVQSLAWSNPEEGLQWGLSQAVDEKDKRDVVRTCLSNWAKQEPDAAAAWYEQQPEHLKSDSTIVKTTNNLKNNGNYKEAMAWAQRAKDIDKANDNKKSIYQSWVKDAPNTAQSWLENEGQEIMQGIDLEELE